MLKINVVTLLPSLFTEHLNNLPFKRAEGKGLVEVRIWDLRKYALDSYGTVDGKPYGGGVGMILMCEPILKALCDIYNIGGDIENIENGQFVQNILKAHPNTKIILTDPKGTCLNQKMSASFSKYENITIICGRYEGVDHRVSEYMVTDVISIGDYVLSGGEVPALVLMESIVRLIPGSIEKSGALEEESFNSGAGDTEYPQYTRPETFKGAKVPAVLLSGNHKLIDDWKKKH